MASRRTAQALASLSRSALASSRVSVRPATTAVASSSRALCHTAALPLCLSRQLLRQPPSSRRSLHASSIRNAETVNVPQLAESLSEGTLKQWMVKVGDFVEADQEVASVETDKIDVSVNAPKSGTITELLAEEDETVAVGAPLFKLEPGDAPSEGGASKSESTSEDKPKKEEPKEEKVEKKEEEPKQSIRQEDGESKSAPEPTKEAKKDDSSRRKKSDAPVENKESEPSRPEAKHSSTDKRPEAVEKPAPPSAVTQQSKPGDRTERRVKMNRMRIRISERLKQSQNAAAALTTFNEIDMSSLMEMRLKYKDAILKKHGVKLGFMSAFSRAAALALQEIPAANASIEGPGAGEQIVYRDYVDLSVAVATPKGLVTPVVRNAENMSFLQIEQAIAELGKKARDGKLSMEDMAGGTFTISNGGIYGSLYGTPIINLPQTAVLGMHAIKEKPVVVDGQIVIRPIMVVALTYDHRLLDGREAVTFLVTIKNYLEDPRRMLLDI